MEQNSKDSCQQSRYKQRDDWSYSFGNQYPGCYRYNHQGSRDVERLFQGGGKAHRLSGVVVIEHKSGDGEDDEGNQHRRHRGVHHVADMGEKRRVRGRRGEHRRVGKGRNLVAEVCPRNNGSRRPSGRETQGFTNSH